MTIRRAAASCTTEVSVQPPVNCDTTLKISPEDFTMVSVPYSSADGCKGQAHGWPSSPKASSVLSASDTVLPMSC